MVIFNDELSTPPLDDKNKLIMYLSVYEDGSSKNRGCRPSQPYRRDHGEVKNLPIMDSATEEVKAEFLDEIGKFKKLSEGGVPVERAVGLVRHERGPLLFDHLSIEAQELFILFMEKEWER